MYIRAAAVTLAFVVAATLGFGPVEPAPAEASDAGKILAGIAAGALVYGALDSADKARRAPAPRQYDSRDRRGYYDGNRSTYKYDQRRPVSQFDRHQQARRQADFNRGYDRGYDHGHRVGYNRGYDRGYDHGWRDGYDYGRSRTLPGWCY